MDKIAGPGVSILFGVPLNDNMHCDALHAKNSKSFVVSMHLGIRLLLTGFYNIRS